MKTIRFFILFLLLPLAMSAQNSFDLQEYQQFLAENQNLSTEVLLQRYPPQSVYYRETLVDTSLQQFAYFDSIQNVFQLSADEREALKRHHFVVTERLFSPSFDYTFNMIYGKDLPVMVTTDAILYALHRSYDPILMDIERAYLKNRLSQLLTGLYESIPHLLSKYQENLALFSPLADVDLYVVVGKSLLDKSQAIPQFASQGAVNAILTAIQQEQYAELPLFSERFRRIDFSQFRPRGHYTDTTLTSYFQAMMWLGRIDFLLTPPPVFPPEPPWTREEIRRMNLGAVLLNELIELSGERPTLNEIDDMIRFMVGESDNLTPTELAEIISTEQITGAGDLLDSAKYDSFQQALVRSPASGQAILSDIFIMNPLSSQPDTLPVSFKLMGQRFVVDSYIFSNVVYDRIIYNDQKIWRPMPDPLDALFVLGNEDALPLLKSALDTYHYSSPLSALRYLVDAYEPDFWQSSLYNLWLQAIRELNPAPEQDALPFFMKTSAWHQEKINTQLASWAQLRHDNLLYAKQSYTGGTMCSFPHSYIEPYPEFYRQIAAFADKAQIYFSQFPSNDLPSGILSYFPRLLSIMDTLTFLSEKELRLETFSDADRSFLQSMLFPSGMCGELPSGWYMDLFYDSFPELNYIIADVHTQPTDEFGNMVGRVLHVGNGEVNLGVFLAQSPSAEYQPMAYVGPVMSYYETITDNFDRLTDERWTDLVAANKLPPRPDWVNLYLMDNEGKNRTMGRELAGAVFTQVAAPPTTQPFAFELQQNYPNPFNPATEIQFSLPRSEAVTLLVYNVAGEKVKTLVNDFLTAGLHRVQWNGRDDFGVQLSSGIYFYRLCSTRQTKTGKMTLLR